MKTILNYENINISDSFFDESFRIHSPKYCSINRTVTKHPYKHSCAFPLSYLLKHQLIKVREISSKIGIVFCNDVGMATQYKYLQNSTGSLHVVYTEWIFNTPQYKDLVEVNVFHYCNVSNKKAALATLCRLVMEIMHW